jgi:hypothetical protein
MFHRTEEVYIKYSQPDVRMHYDYVLTCASTYDLDARVHCVRSTWAHDCTRGTQFMSESDANTLLPGLR